MRALSKLTYVELKLHLREPLTLIFTLILPLMFLIVMGEVFGKNPSSSDFYRGVGAMDYYAPVYIGVVIAAVGLIAIPVHLAGYRERGVLRRLRASSLSLRSLLSSQLVVGILIAIACVFILIIPTVVIYHIHSPHDILLILAASLLAIFSFTALGIFLGFILPTARAAQGVGVPLFFIMYMLSGAGPPRDVMSPVMQNVGQAMPLWHVTSVVQDAWLGYGWNVSASLILVGILILAAGITYLIFRRE